MDNIKEKQLVKKAIKGDIEAFKELYKAKAKEILYHCTKVLGNRQDAEDAAQEIIIDIYQDIKKLRNPEFFSTWLYRMVSNECNTMLKKVIKNQNQINIDDQAEKLFTEKEEFLPEEYAQSSEKRETLLSIINELPEKRRESILMYYYAEMNYSEIASATGTTISTVATNIKRARDTVKNKLQEADGKLEISHTLSALPVMTEVFRADADSIITGRVVETFITSCNEKIAILSTAAGTAAVNAVTGLSAKVLAKLLAFVIVGTIVITSLMISNLDPWETKLPQQNIPSASVKPDSKKPAQNKASNKSVDDTDKHREKTEVVTDMTTTKNPDKEKEKPPVYNKGELIFIGGDCNCGHVNPRDIRITGESNDVNARDWKIIRASDDKVVYSGTQNKISVELADLFNSKADDHYTISYIYTGKKGNDVQMKRAFIIDTEDIRPNQYE